MSSFNSPYDLTDRRAAGHPNGYCQNCGRPSTSLRSDFCSSDCRYQYESEQARAEQLEQEAREVDRARATVIPDEVLARREPERPDEHPQELAGEPEGPGR
jgi:predicted amidophosphoribosyltransferase